MAVNIFSMPSSSTLLLFSLAFGLTNARPWQGASKTAVYQADEWSPRPTNVPVNPRELFKRKHLGVEICGWLGGNLASPVACGSGSSCVHDTVHGYIGCCATSGPCTAGVYTSCVDESSSNWGEDSGLVNDGIFACPSGQACYRNTYPGGYHQYNCGSSDQATTVETSYSGQPTDILLQIVFTGVIFSPSAAPTTTTSSSISSSTASTTSSSSQTSSSQTSSQASSSSTDSSTSSSQTSSSSPSSTSNAAPNAAATAAAATTTAAVHSSSSNTKAIVGGVVGGLAALTAILGVLLFLLQRRHAQRNQQRAGSFVSGLKKGQPPPNRPFQRIAPYSPDDFQSSMTERERATPSTIAAAFPNNHLTPPLPDLPLAFLPPHAGEDRRGEDALLVGSEIDDFSRSYNEATRYHQSPVRERSREPDYAFETPGFEVPIFAPHHTLAGSDPGPLNIPVLGAGAAPLRGGSRGSERDRERDRLMGEDKEGGARPGTSRGFGGNVREEGWSPQQLRPSPPREREIGSDVQRYQLVDDVPRGGVPVLHSPGQLRGSRAPRGRNST